MTVDWLEKNLSNPKLVILDIRKVEDYREGHIPGAVSASYRTWAYGKAGKREEIPRQDDLFDAVGDAGIKPHSLVVVVCSMALFTSLTPDPSRLHVNETGPQRLSSPAPAPCRSAGFIP